MIKQKQLNRHDPENGIIGDCHRTALACLLDMPTFFVQHVNVEQWEDAGKFWEHFRRVLEDLGYVEAKFYHHQSLEWLFRTMQRDNPSLYYILGGNSRNGTGHSVIAKGNQIVWDPALDDSGIVGPLEDGFYSVSLLVPLRFTDKGR